MNDLALRIRSITWEAEGILSFDLRPLFGGVLPPFTAGAHVDLRLPGGITRSYSLINPQTERHRYVVAVNRDRASRGGSVALHDLCKPGDRIGVAPPRNGFPLVEDAAHTVLIAGGIGVTPLYAMAHRLTVLGRPWTMHYAARSRAAAAFLEELTALGDCRPHFDAEAGGVLDVAGIVAAAPRGAHLYACGPGSMLDAFTAATAGMPQDRVRLERFSGEVAAADAGGFTVVLARSKREIAVPRGATILKALRDAGLDAPSSCEEGICGTCETVVLEGEPDHRDLVLSKAEQASGKVMMICCSGARSPRLVLDL